MHTRLFYQFFTNFYVFNNLFFHRLKEAEFVTTNKHGNDNKAYYPTIYRCTPGTSLKIPLSIEMFNYARTEDVIEVLQDSTILRNIRMKLFDIKDILEFVRTYKALANSRLHSVAIDNQLNLELFQAVSMLLWNKELPKNSTVKKLEITSQSEDDPFIDLFVKCFSELTHLKIEIGSSKTKLSELLIRVSSIFIQQLHLTLA